MQLHAVKPDRGQPSSAARMEGVTRAGTMRVGGWPGSIPWVWNSAIYIYIYIWLRYLVPRVPDNIQHPSPLGRTPPAPAHVFSARFGFFRRAQFRQASSCFLRDLPIYPFFDFFTSVQIQFSRHVWWTEDPVGSGGWPIKSTFTNEVQLELISFHLRCIF
jgi:hypothetical protein